MAEQHTYARLHHLSGQVLRFDLKERAREILRAARETNAGRAAETLVKEGPLRLTILGFTAGSLMRDHRAHEPASLEVIDGLVTVRTADGAEDLRSGEALVLAAQVTHSVLAKTDAVVLLTIAMNSAEPEA